jgi:MoxR-like ATPase
MQDFRHKANGSQQRATILAKKCFPQGKTLQGPFAFPEATRQESATVTHANPTPIDAAAAARLSSIDDVQAALATRRYIADRGLATALFLALKRNKPLLLEGEPGVGKTEVARALADVLGTRLIRLQCYEGIDQSAAVYEWNYARQLLYIRALDARTAGAAGETDRLGGAQGGDGSRGRLNDVFGPEFLIRRPLLQALDASAERTPVLLIDELDRSDAEFEAYLLELLSDYAVTIPEIGTLRATRPPVVVLTSNRTRDIHDALRRRCLYYWIDYPSLDKEYAIVLARVPEAPELLARQVVAFVQALRGEDLFKAPGVAETLDWLEALVTLGQTELTEAAARDALGALLKYQDDMQKVTSGDLLRRLVEKVRTTLKG